MKNIVITGATSGIGKELASLLQKNHNVLVLARDANKLSALQKEFPKLKIGQVDLSTDLVKHVASTEIQKHFNDVDVLINNAGTLINKPVLEISRADMQSSFATNVFGLIEMCQAIIPLMQKGGHIVNIGSMGGFQGSAKFAGLSVYSATKGAVATFTECLAEELKETKIKVNCLALGAAQTEMLSKAFPGYEAPISAKKMAEYIADFSLNGHEWLNGKIIPVSMSTP